MIRYFSKAAICSSLLIAALGPAASAFAQSEEEMDILQMIYKDKDLVTPGRSPKPISQVAENITVINAEEIEAINAHTLTEVLYHVTGVQVDATGGPWSQTNVMIQGSSPFRGQVRVMIDGVTINTMSDNLADVSALPVQNIERIEIIKGPASSAWGSAMGGIINVITKSPDPERKVGGSLSASVGERGTGDFRADLTGTLRRFGYYIYGGGITSDGLTSGTDVGKGDFYTKLKWEPTEKAALQLSVAYNKGSRGELTDGDFSVRDSYEYFFASPLFTYAINDSLDLDVSGRVSTKRIKISQFNAGALFSELIVNELSAGGSAKLNWRHGISNLLVGGDYDNGAMESEGITGGRQSQKRWAFFANDTLTLGDFAVTPGVRYDNNGVSGDFVSPSLGLTYTLFEKTIFRGFVARGFNIPSLADIFRIDLVPNPNLKPEKVWSYQLGVESSAGRYFWFKFNWFIHDISDIIIIDNAPKSINDGKQRRQGVETEVRTLPLWNTSLLAGYSFIDATNRATKEVVQNVPRHTWDVGIDYNDHDAWRGALRGHWIWWNVPSDPVDPRANGRYYAMIWDLHLGRKVMEKGSTSVEAFFSVHNIFNGSQYSNGFFPNPGRWFEGGLKCKF